MFAQSTSDTATQLYYLDLFVLTVRFFRKKRKSKLKKRKNVANSKNVKYVFCNPVFYSYIWVVATAVFNALPVF